MFSDLRIAFSSKLVIFILTLSFVLRLVFQVLILPNTPSTFGPDEGIYAELAQHVSLGLPSEKFPGYGSNLYYSAWSFIEFAVFLIKLGLEELSAVRVASTIYGITSILLLTLCWIAYQRLRSKKEEDNRVILDRKFFICLIIFAFMPSSFLWSNLGLRESASQFWTITTFYFLLKLFDSNGPKSALNAVFAVCALAFTYGSRPQVAFIVSLVSVIFMTLGLIRLRRGLPLLTIIIGTLVGQALSTPPLLAPEKLLVAVNEDGDENIVVSKQCLIEGQTIEVDDLKYECNSINADVGTAARPIQSLKNKVQTVKTLEYKRNVNAQDAQSALPTSSCQNISQEIFTIIKCNLLQLPYRLFSFLFRPLILFDYGSTSFNFAALENLMWMALILWSMWKTAKVRKLDLDGVVNLALIFYILVFASAAALYEGNLGTAFRHKSTILWSLVFILMVAPNVLPKKFKRYPFFVNHQTLSLKTKSE